MSIALLAAGPGRSSEQGAGRQRGLLRLASVSSVVVGLAWIGVSA